MSLARLPLKGKSHLKRCVIVNGFAVLLLATLSVPSIAQTRYSITDIGSLGGDVWPYAAISNSGYVTGSSQTPNGIYRAYIWDKVNGMVAIRTLCSSTTSFSFGLGVNSAGQVAGVCYDPAHVFQLSFRSDRSNQVFGMGSPLDSCGAFARAINEGGTVTGDVYYDCQLMRGNGFSTSDATFRELMGLGGPFQQTGSYSSGTAINKDGVVAGFSTLTNETRQRAVIWGTNGIQDLGLGEDSIALGINDRQQVVGSFVSDQFQHAFIWNSSAGKRDLGTLTGGLAAQADAVNNNDQVVGRANSPNDPDNDHAFIWDANNGMKDLNDLIQPDPTWLLTEATGINDNGQIVGWGLHHGVQSIFVLTPVKEPLIFIPGIAGSKLSEVGDGNIWPALFRDVTRLTLDPQKQQTNIFVPDAIRSTAFAGGLVTVQVYAPLINELVNEGYVEYKVNNDPVRRTTAGCDLTQKQDDPAQNPSLFVFAYDWRKSTSGNAAALKDYVGCVQQFYPGAKVNLLAHSMGGVVSRRYIIDNPGTHKVNKLVTIASPFAGAPKALHVLESGEFFNKWPLDSLFASDMKALSEFFPGAHELIPGRLYFALGGRPFGETTWDYDKNGRIDPTYDTFNKLATGLDRQHARSLPGAVATQFHDKAGQDDWRGDQSGIKYYHIYGAQKLARTVGKALAISETICDAPGVNCRSQNSTKFEKVVGDGTVPLLSTERIGSGLNLNAPGSIRVPFTSDSPKKDDAYEHTFLTQNPDVWAEIRKALSPANPQQARNLFSKPAANTLAHHKRIAGTSTGFQDPATQIDPDVGYYVHATGIDFINVSDEFGNANTPVDGILFGAHVPGVDYDVNETSIDITTPAEQVFTFSFRSTGQSVLFEILKGAGNGEPTQAIRYLDLSLPAAVIATLQVGPNGVSDLRYDADGDGTFESVVTPTANAIGMAALDTLAPEITFSAAPQGASQMVSINATDFGSGIKAIRYSIDGSHFSSYSQPFLVDPTQTPFAFAFAEDNIANRSGVVSFAVPPANASPVITSLGPAQAWIGLKNSDDVGTKFDLLAEVLKNGMGIGSGQLNGIPGGSSGFNNAKLQSMNLTMSNSASFSPGDVLTIRLSARIAASSGHRSGTARLWFNDSSANSRFSATIANAPTDFFLTTGMNLSGATGAGPKYTADVTVDRAVGGNPFKPFSTWSKTF